MVYVYPAIFTEVDGKGYDIVFPDLPGTHSQGKNLAEAVGMARNALAIWLDSCMQYSKEMPPPSNPAVMKCASGTFVTVIDVDMDAYRRHWAFEFDEEEPDAIDLELLACIDAKRNKHYRPFSEVIEALGIDANDLQNYR